MPGGFERKMNSKMKLIGLGIVIGATLPLAAWRWAAGSPVKDPTDVGVCVKYGGEAKEAKFNVSDSLFYCQAALKER